MADEATSVGKIQLDIEITKSSAAKEMEGLSKAFNSGIKGSFGNIGGQMTGFIKNTFSNMVNGIKSFSQVGVSSNKQVAQSTDDISIKMQQLVNQMESATNRAEMHRQKLLELQAQYDRLSRMGMGDSDKGRKLLDQITLAEDKVNRYGAVSDRTRLKIEQLEQSIANLGETANKSNRGFKNAEEGSKKAGRSFKLFGDQANKSSSKVCGFAAMISRSFRTVLRRLFVYSLILKSIRGMMNYMNAGLKTNKQFASLLNVIGTNLRVAFQPIYDFILPALNALMKGIATATTYIAMAISALFGKSYKQSYDYAKGIETAKKAMAGYGGAAKKAGKEAKGALAGFDEINQLDLSKDDSGGFEMAMPDTSTVNLTGFEKFKGMLQPTIDSLKTLGLALEPLKNFAAQGLRDFYNDFLKPVGQWTFGEGLPRLIDAMTKGIAKINWQPIKDGLNNLWAALTPFAINVGEGLLWFWENALVPLGTWVYNEIVPRFLRILAGAIKILNEVIDVLKPIGKWLWDKFLKPLAEWTGGAIVDILDGIAYAFEAIADYISGIQDVIANSNGFLDALVNVGVYLVKGLFNGIISALSGIGQWLWNNLVSPIINWVKKLFGIASPSKVFAEIGIWLIEGLLQGISNTWRIIKDFFTIALDNLRIFFEETWSNIKIKAEEIWNAIAEFFVLLWEGITTTLTEAWNAIVEFLLGLWNGLSESATVIWTGIKVFFEETWTTIKTTIEEVWNNIKEFFAITWNHIKAKTEEVWNAIKTFLIEQIWNPIKTNATTIFNSIKDTISNIFNTIKSITSTIWNDITSGLKESFDTIYNNSVTIFNKMKDFIKGITDSIEGFFKAMVNGVIRALNSMINGLNKLNVDIPDWVPGIGGKSLGFNIPNIPYLAKGGIIDQPTLAMVGERGKEAVVPLENNTEWMDKLASVLISALMGAMQLNNSSQTSGESGDIILQIDGVTIGRILGPILDREKGRIGDSIIQPI